ncbi:BZ3500_MvSof-1268-A1-R1_Chr10-1g02679 [Microbotryum saponariae]|uniref:BZ3500_MvSof-1268-A1-R1_Chr10-1g02679 protein n=1 Tax=Microbotryum saponariae TaxID=289078 RepID=A0A2X0L495_9BASI|nr:BZ3500_MvSof-1268-A1-R1_Chr10-1g02679 [Microbotryum saponariae]SDA06168.1 BZ3501_MvSof-1269-A2-R1_Chr10-1g02280 [Microbotryum saponariae]
MSAYLESSHPTQASSTAGATTSSTKRRRVEGDYGYIAPSTSRTAAKAAAAHQAAQASTSTPTSTSSSRAHAHANTSSHASSQNTVASGTQFLNPTPREQEMMAAAKARFAAPTLSLASLPPPALQRYLSRYGLLESHGSLSYHHAVFPVPPLPVTLPSPLTGRQLSSRRLYRPVTTATGGANTTAMAEDQHGTTSTPAKRPRWQEPKTAEFKGLSAYDDPVVVTNRLAAKAKEHWDKRESVKEGETLTNFMFALRMRAHTLRATPPG